ncbi:class I SAM-dependent methyltransferase [Cohaesibacter intestini]|uniref:class I SAM-dependent methyltransferase n=1 Tax=Cohaesibacter intestini TaxID=2211145 RepID=UPI00130030E3|nr:class I SAM-dependent methyltransferase [Cohaesibacter intestini]
MHNDPAFDHFEHLCMGDDGSSFPANFDPDLYRSKYKDLTQFPPKALKTHYFKHGINEGRVPGEIWTRDAFIDLVDPDSAILEIGPFLNPMLRRPDWNVDYFEVLDRDDLVERAKRLMAQNAVNVEKYTENLKKVPDIQWVDAHGDISTIPQKYDHAFSCHCIEHQVDIIKHLNDVYDLLNPNGCYFMVVPDGRFSFDHFCLPSRGIDMVGAHLEKRKLQSPSKVLEHRMEITHNDPVLHWRGEHGVPHRRNPEKMGDPAFAKRILKEAESANRHYVDVHNWILSPHVFWDCFEFMRACGLVKFELRRIYFTVRNKMEFYVILQKPE